jgi:UDP-3-O-[3-hydroxymyristoyl] glucosamine N-acyltransferase
MEKNFVIDRECILGSNIQFSSFVSIGKAKIGDNVKIGHGVFIDDDVIINNDAVIHPNVVIYPGVTVGAGTEIFPGAFLGKEPKGAGATARSPEFSRQINIGTNCSIGPNAVIFYDVTIGNNTLLGDGASIREKCRIGSYCILSRYVTVNYATTIGDRTKVMDNSHITGKTRIGNDVFISVMVGTTNDNVIRAGYEEDRILGPHIEDHVVVGVGASFLPAVRIGAGATVAAGAVVTRNVEANTLVAGVPAKFVRRLKNEG